MKTGSVPLNSSIQPTAKPTITENTLHGWDAWTLANGTLTATVVPAIGGRMMSLRLGPYEFLFTNPQLLGKQFSAAEHVGDGSMRHWKNYGGDKTWPAPQGWDGPDQWPGPPDGVLDSGAYTAVPHVDHGSAAITLTSAPETRHTGIRCTRRLMMRTGVAAMQLDLTFENVIDRPVRWSIWNVTQLDCRESAELGSEPVLYIGVDETAAANPSGLPYQVMFGETTPGYLAQLDAHVAPGVIAVRHCGQIGKIGVHSAPNWAAFANPTHGFVLCFRAEHAPGAPYPDNGATIECWTEAPDAPAPVPIRSPGQYMEAELLSPLHRLPPGAKAEFTIHYGAARCPAPIVDVKAIGCVNEPLRVDHRSGWARVRGIFGVFAVGEAALLLYDDDGDEVGVSTIGNVSPLNALHVDAMLEIPPTADRLALVVRWPGADGDVSHAVLGEVNVG